MDCHQIFFVTTITAGRFPIFRRDSTSRLFLLTLAHYREQGRFLLHEFVIMPDHVHALLTPAPHISLERVMHFLKGGFSCRLRFRGPVWQESFTNHRVRDFDDYENHRKYIRMNPVRALLAERAELYCYSSAAGVMRMDPVQWARPPLVFENALLQP